MEESPMLNPDRTPDAVTRGRSVFARLAVPHTFGPDLRPGEALLAVAGILARIFGACLLFAVWGGISAWTWNGIASRFWRAADVLPLVLIFLAALVILMMTISAVEERIAPKH